MRRLISDQLPERGIALHMTDDARYSASPAAVEDGLIRSHIRKLSDGKAYLDSPQFGDDRTELRIAHQYFVEVTGRAISGELYAVRSETESSSAAMSLAERKIDATDDRLVLSPLMTVVVIMEGISSTAAPDMTLFGPSVAFESLLPMTLIIRVLVHLPPNTQRHTSNTRTQHNSPISNSAHTGGTSQNQTTRRTVAHAGRNTHAAENEPAHEPHR